MITNYENCKKKLEIAELAKTKGAIVRSRMKWMEEGERNTKFFLNLGKKEQQSTQSIKLKMNKGKYVNIRPKFYERFTNISKTYIKKDKAITNMEEQMNDFMQDIQHKVLDEENQEFCDSEITTKEMSEAQKCLNNKSAPGSDGLTADFYKVVWKSLKMPLFDSFTQSIEQGQLSTSQRRGIITLIHKGKDTARENINNWRPITLTNVDYKILTKLLARRLHGVIKKIVHETQSGFFKGRNISTHIRLLDDLIKYADYEQLGGIVISLDYKKAFDTDNKECIMAGLKKFNFGAQFIKFISTILSKTERPVKNGGWLSKWFQTDRRVRQGCCVSPLLFVLVVKLLAKK